METACGSVVLQIAKQAPCHMVLHPHRQGLLLRVDATSDARVSIKRLKSWVKRDRFLSLFTA